jgi:hypothetical protein
MNYPFKVSKRIAPTAITASSTASDYVVQFGNTGTNCSAVPTFNNSTTENLEVYTTVSGTPFSSNGGVALGFNNSSAFIGVSAEL